MDICDKLSFESKIGEKIITFKNSYDINSLIAYIKETYKIDSDNDFVKLLVKLFKKENVYDLIFKSGYNNEYLTVQSYCEFLYPKPNVELYQNLKKILYENKEIGHRWQSEYLLYKLIKTYYNDAIYQYKSDWLGAQSIDIYIPSLKIGFEYQGVQHYEPIDYFGGQEGFEYNVKRDARKFEICQDQGIKLIYWKFSEKISKDNLVAKMSALDIELNKNSIFGIENINVEDKFICFNTIDL